MATPTVGKIADPGGAERAVELLTTLSKQQLIQVHDSATVM